ncbi:hypothetical protein ACJX0J_021222, partial [Zea mays]
MDQHDSMVDSPRRRHNLLSRQGPTGEKGSNRYEIKGFFVVIRACQLLAQHNETVFNEKVVNFMPDVTVISMDNYNDTTCI